ncbi:hypothetical protein [Nocardia sp. NPDC051750]|uniref:hypothetical protein n=1 Tax=Nocardia sp. NPDC051750 TaxID=3364325 RepID=UPI0037B84F37
MPDSQFPNPLDLEIDLLLGMRCEDSLKESKLQELGISFGTAKDIAKQVDTKLQFGRDQFENLRRILDIDPGSGENPTLSYRLNLWPDFNFVVTSESGHWSMARFVRAADAPAPDLSAPGNLEPWSVCIQDLESEFPTLRCTDAFPPWEEFIFEDLSGVRYGADFSYGLLQQIEVLPGKQSPM